MALYGQVQVDDYVACVIRSAVDRIGGFAWLTMGIVMAESGFNIGALGDQAPGPDVVVGGVTYHPYQDPRTGLYYCSLGLLQLNMCGGQGSGHQADELLNPIDNLNIGQPPIAIAVLQGTQQGLQGDTFIEYVATHSGHPGFVSYGDARVQRIVSCCHQLITNSAGQLAPWPDYNPGLCTSYTPPPAPPPPIGTWSEPLTPTTKDQAQTVIEAHFQRVDALFKAF